jgi:chromosome segregation ATPase
MLTEQLLAEINTLKDEIKNLNEIITVALNSSNACHFRAIEYQSQRDTLNSKNLKLEYELAEERKKETLFIEAMEGAITKIDALEKQRDTLAEALLELLDALGATSKPHELMGYGISKYRAQQIIALAAAKGGEA